MPDIENSRKTAEKGAEWVRVKQPKNSPKNSRNTRKTVKTAGFGLFFWPFFGCFQCRAFGTSVDACRDCNSKVKSCFKRGVARVYRRGRGTRTGPLAS